MSRALQAIALAGFVSALLVASTARAQVTFDAFGRSANVNRTLYPLTVGSGTNRALAVFVHASAACADPQPVIGSVTYAGVPLIQILTRSLAGCAGSTSQLWALPPGTQPTPGTNTVEVRLATGGPTVPRAIHSGAISATGVDQVTTFTTTATNDGNSATASLTLGASGPNDLVIDSVCAGASVGGTPQVSRWLGNATNFFACNNTGGATAAGGTTGLSWSVTTARWAMLGAAFKAAAAQTVAFDAVANTPGGNALAYPLTVGSGVSRALAVFTHVGTICGIVEPTVDTVTFAGTPLIRVIDHPAASCVGAAGSLWITPPGTEPATGTHDVVVNLASPILSWGTIHSGAFSAFGVDQSTALTSFGATDGDSTPVSLTLGASGTDDLVVDSFCNGLSVIGTVQTQRWVTIINANNSCNNSGGATAPGGTTSLSWDGGANDNWILVGGPFKAAMAQDAGGGGDGGSSDAGDGGDAGSPDAGAPLGHLTVGCDCSSTGGLLAIAALVAVALRGGRRRARGSLVGR